MAIEFGNAMQMLEGSLDLRLVRQAVLSSNLANLDTPGFRPADLKFEGYMKGAELAGEAAQESAMSESAEVVVSDAPADTLDGNGVDLDSQVAKLDENRIRYDAALELVRRKLAMVRYAATMGNG